MTAPPGKRRWTYYPLHTLPKPLDVVWCAFPEDEKPREPALKARPALVRTIGLNRSQTAAFIEVTYGTSKGTAEIRPLDLYVANLSDMNDAGLPRPTYFVLGRTIWLPWALEWFVKREDGTGPIVGHLAEASITQLEVLKVLRRQPPPPPPSKRK